MTPRNRVLAGCISVCLSHSVAARAEPILRRPPGSALELWRAPGPAVAPTLEPRKALPASALPRALEATPEAGVIGNEKRFPVELLEVPAATKDLVRFDRHSFAAKVEAARIPRPQKLAQTTDFKACQRRDDPAQEMWVGLLCQGGIEAGARGQAVVLVWDWKGDEATPKVDGFRLYALPVPNAKKLRDRGVVSFDSRFTRAVVTGPAPGSARASDSAEIATLPKAALTALLVDQQAPHDGELVGKTERPAQRWLILERSREWLDGRCFAVAAFKGERESALSSRFCVSPATRLGGKKVTLLRNHWGQLHMQRRLMESDAIKFIIGVSNKIAQGFTIADYADPLARRHGPPARVGFYRNLQVIDRAALSFDLDELRGRVIQKATLHMAIKELHDFEQGVAVHLGNQPGAVIYVTPEEADGYSWPKGATDAEIARHRFPRRPNCPGIQIGTARGEWWSSRLGISSTASPGGDLPDDTIRKIIQTYEGDYFDTFPAMIVVPPRRAGPKGRRDHPPFGSIDLDVTSEVRSLAIGPNYGFVLRGLFENLFTNVPDVICDVEYDEIELRVEYF